MKPDRIEMHRYGPPEVLRPVEYTPPAPGPSEVLVRSQVSGVNRADCFIRSGEWPMRGSFPYVPGLEVSGHVEAVGAEVENFRPGDSVITMMQRLGGIHGQRAGGYQTHVLVEAGSLVKLPAMLDPVLAGQFGLPAVTALEAIAELDVREGHRVLVTAASSAVGTMALQMIAARRARPVATTRGQAKADHLRECGAAEVLDTTNPSWTALARGCDRVLDLVGRATFAECVSVLSPQGRLVFAGGTSGGELAFSGWDLMKPVTLTGYSSENLDRDALIAAIAAIAGLHRHKLLRCVQVHEFPLRDAARAHAALESGTLAGRIVLRMA